MKHLTAIKFVLVNISLRHLETNLFWQQLFIVNNVPFIRNDFTMWQEHLQRNVMYNFWMAIIRTTWYFCWLLPTGHLFLFLFCIYASNKCTSDYFGVYQTHRNRFLHLKRPVENKFPCKHCSLQRKTLCPEPNELNKLIAKYLCPPTMEISILAVSTYGNMFPLPPLHWNRI